MMDWLWAILDRIMIGVLGFHAMLEHLVGWLQPYAFAIVTGSGILLLVLLAMKFFTIRGRRLHASILFALMGLLVGLGLIAVDAEDVERHPLQYFLGLEPDTLQWLEALHQRIAPK